MKNRLSKTASRVLIVSGIVFSVVCHGQNSENAFNIHMYALPSGRPDNDPAKYRMTAEYINRDLYGNFTGKSKVTGDYTRGLDGGYVSWNNVYISNATGYLDPFPAGVKQEYMENMKFIPSKEMLHENAFIDFPSSPDNVLARNLIWDMMAFEGFSWGYSDSLEINKPFISKNEEEFDMAEIGKYNHKKIILCWQGISEINNEVCAVIDFNCIDNIIKLTLDQMSSTGTE